MKINIFHPFFAFRLEMHVRCDNQYKTGAEGTILGQPMLFECMTICILSFTHGFEMRGSIVYLLIVKYLSHRFCVNSATVYLVERPCRGILREFIFFIFFFFRVV